MAQHIFVCLFLKLFLWFYVFYDFYEFPNLRRRRRRRWWWWWWWWWPSWWSSSWPVASLASIRKQFWHKFWRFIIVLQSHASVAKKAYFLLAAPQRKRCNHSTTRGGARQKYRLHLRQGRWHLRFYSIQTWRLWWGCHHGEFSVDRGSAMPSVQATMAPVCLMKAFPVQNC